MLDGFDMLYTPLVEGLIVPGLTAKIWPLLEQCDRNQYMTVLYLSPWVSPG
jgi:hypothetical protein